MKKLLTGNEAVARGAYEAGIRFASAYPGTPSTEIMENLATYPESILAEWAPNEKVALEAASGAAIAGARAIASMKHVGVNVAADPLFTIAYTGIRGGLLLVSADEPGMHSSQNEQDNRYYARFAKIALLEPSDSQEAKDMVHEAMAISEEYDTPVLMRLTTRVCHSKSIVETKDRVDVPIRTYVKEVEKYVTVPAHSRALRHRVEQRLKALEQFSNETPLNYEEYHDHKLGVVSSGMAFRYAKEAFGNDASYMKLGFTNPLPIERIRAFADQVDELIVIEENDPYIADALRAEGIVVSGRGKLPYTGEMTPDVIRKAFFGETLPGVALKSDKVVGRPPAYCAGCPHRGFFVELGKRKDVVVSGDIGCYALGYMAPYNAMDFNICMGASFSSGHGMQKALDMVPGNGKRVVSVLGDSTFFHTGINSLIEVVYNRSRTVNVILDNRITGMTGHQENPGSGYTAQGLKVKAIEIEPVVRALGIEHLRTVDPNRLDQVREALDWALALDEPSVIITRYPCVLKRFSKEDVEEFGALFQSKCAVESDACIGCRQCMKVGCPALSFSSADKKATIDPAQCVGCEVCMQVCPTQAIVKEEK